MNQLRRPSTGTGGDNHHHQRLISTYYDDNEDADDKCNDATLRIPLPCAMIFLDENFDMIYF